ncbi:hypothetical protein [Streptomyces sp. NPDC058434]|uniref:hypothetical protein n=1 Tax=Streptomyces sp. NPDC058434 TaxID=3346498 RepID=UPI00365D05D0
MDEEARQKAARFPCALEDPLVMRAWAQARHMVRTPDEAFGSEDVRLRVKRWLQGRTDAPQPPAGPPRGSWESVVAAREATGSGS